MSARLLLALLCALGAARADIRIRIEGNEGMGRRKLLEVIDPEPADYTRDGLRSWKEDAEFYVLDLYRVYGYFEARVETTLKPREKDDPDEWDAEIRIAEGPRYAFDTVRVLGARLRQEDEAPAALTRDEAAGDPGQGVDKAAEELPTPFTPRPAEPDSQPPPELTGPALDTSDLEARMGEPFRQDALLADRRRILRAYGNAGFVRVEADDKLDIRPVTRTVAVDYLVDPGIPVIFDSLVVRNLRAPPLDTLAGITKERILQDLVPYERGDTVRMGSNDKLIEKLQYTGAFNFVRIKDSLRPGDDGRSTLYLFAEEHVPGNIRSSLFYETQYGPGVSVDARHSNLAGSLNEVRSGFSMAQERQTLYAGYGSPLTLGLLVRFDDDLDFNWYQDDPKVHGGKGMFGGDFRWANSARLTWPWSYWLRLVSESQLEALSRMTSDTTRDRDLSLNFIQTAFATFVDQPMDPVRGVKVSLTWGNGGALQRRNVYRFAEYRHNWFEIKTSQYYMLPGLRMLKLATRLDGGRFFGEGGANSERFFLGGSRSVRSQEYQDLCPDHPGTDVCEAQDSSLAYVQASAEVRFEPFWWLNPRGKLHALAPLQVVPFADFGKVWDVRRPTTWTWSGTSPPAGEGYALGLGVRYPLLGIFNLRMDFAFVHGPHFFWLDLAQAF